MSPSGDPWQAWSAEASPCRGSLILMRCIGDEGLPGDYPGGWGKQSSLKFFLVTRRRVRRMFIVPGFVLSSIRFKRHRCQHRRAVLPVACRGRQKWLITFVMWILVLFFFLYWMNVSFNLTLTFNGQMNLFKRPYDFTLTENIVSSHIADEARSRACYFALTGSPNTHPVLLLWYQATPLKPSVPILLIWWKST